MEVNETNIIDKDKELIQQLVIMNGHLEKMSSEKSSVALSVGIIATIMLIQFLFTAGALVYWYMNIRTIMRPF